MRVQVRSVEAIKNAHLARRLFLASAVVAVGYLLARFIGTPLMYIPLSLLGGIILIRSPFLGLLSMLALIPGEELTTFIAGRTFVFILGVVTFGAWLIKVLLKRDRIKVIPIPMGLVFLWFLWGLASSLWAQEQTPAIGKAIDIAQGGLFLLLLQNLIDNEKRLKTVLTVYFVATVFFSLVAIGTTVSEGLKRAVVAEGQNPNALARALGLGFLLMPYLYERLRKTWWRFPLVSGSALILLAVFMTGSRGAWLGLITSVGLTWVIARGRLARMRSLITATVFLLVGIPLLHYYGLIGEWQVRRVLKLASPEQTIESARVYIWAVGWEMIKNNPILGVGLQNFPARFEDYIDAAGVAGKPGIYPGRDPHSIYLSAQAELGLPGIALILALFWVIFHRLLPYRTDKRAICGILLLLFTAFSGTVATIQYRKFFWLALGLSTLIPVVIRREKSKSAYPHTHVS